MFRLVKGRPEIGDRRQIRTESNMGIEKKSERATDSIMAEKECTEKLPKTEKGPIQLAPTEWGNDRGRYNDRHCQNRLGPNEWRQLAAPSKYKGSCAKGGHQNPVCKTLRNDPGGKAYQYIDWALRTNEGSVATNMPLLRGFTNYADREADARRWAITSYIRPINMGGGTTSLII